MRLITINRKGVSAGIAVILIMLIFPSALPSAGAQTSTAFTSSDKFSIPAYNGTISFAVNGTYSKATLQNDSWTFVNLRLSRSLPLQNFTVSAQNCNITIISYSSFNTTRQTLRLIYSVEGVGRQVFNFGVRGQAGQFAGVDWSVIVGDNVFLAEGENWNISPDGTLTVDGATGFVNVVHWGFYSNNLSSSNLPFYEQHSVAIATAITLALIVAVAVVFKLKIHEPPEEKP